MMPKRPRRREPLELQLTAMIDIFAMLVIFLLKSTVLGAVDVQVPPDTRLPDSMSKESLEVSPKVMINAEQVNTSFLSKNAVRVEDVGSLRPAIQKYISALPKDSGAQATTLSVIADKEVPYRKIYDVVKVFREAGFGNVMFIANGTTQE
jgi:biopolymer transport protein ExbD